MTAPTGWPGAPGYPENPEQSGWHEVGGTTAFWRSKSAEWVEHSVFTVKPAAKMAAEAYGGRLYTPAEVAALVAAGQEAAFREGWKAGRDYGSAEATAYEWGTRIVGQPTEDEAWRDSDAAQSDAPAALARMIAEAEARGMERAAGIAEAPLTVTGPIKGPAGIRRVKEALAAAIRAAAAKESKA